MPKTPSLRAKSSSNSLDQLSKRRLNESRDTWLGLFTDALNALLSSDDDRTKALTRAEADELAQSALNVADAALAVIEERFPNI